MFDPIDEIIYKLWVNDPIRNLMLMLRGGYFIEDPESMYNVELELNTIPDVRFSQIVMNDTYANSLEPSLAKIKVYNDSNKPRLLHYEVYQKLMEITTYGASHDDPRGEWLGRYLLLQDTRPISLGPNGMKELEIYYRTPPVARFQGVGEFMGYRLVISFGEPSTGGRAQLTDVALADFGTP